MAISLFDTRTLLAITEELKKPKTFLRDTFFGNEIVFDTEHVDIDLVTDVRRVAIYNKRDAQGQYVEKKGYDTNSYIPPYLSPFKTLRPKDMKERNPGFHIYGGQGSRQKIIEKITREMMELDEMITRAEEIQAKQAVFDGIIDLKDIDGNPVETQINFNRNAQLNMTEAQLKAGYWTNTTAKPLTDLDEARDRIGKFTGFAADIVIMHHRAFRDFKATTQVKDELDNRRFESENQLVRRLTDKGAVFRGEVEGFMIFTYSEFFVDEGTSGLDEIDLVPYNKVLVTSSKARASMLYGAIEYTGEENAPDFFAVKRFPQMWTEKNPNRHLLQMHSAPLAVTHHPDAYAVLTVAA